MLSKKFVVILVLAALLAATQIIDVEAGSVGRKVNKADREDAAADKENSGSNVRKNAGFSPFDPPYY